MAWQGYKAWRIIPQVLSYVRCGKLYFTQPLDTALKRVQDSHMDYEPNDDDTHAAQQHQQDEERRRQEEEGFAMLTYEQRVDYWYANPPEPYGTTYSYGSEGSAADGRPLFISTGRGPVAYEYWCRDKEPK